MSSPQRARVAAALARQRPDRVPLGEFFVEDRLVAALAGMPPGMQVAAATRSAVLEGLHLDAVACYPELTGRPLLGVHLAGDGSGDGQGDRQGHGRGDRSGRRHVGSALGLPDPGGLDWSPVRAARERSPLFVFAMLPGPFGELAYLMGIERFLLLSWRRPDEARRLAEAMVDYGIELARLALAHGAQGFVVGEDIAWDRGLLLRAALYRSLFLPALEREIVALRALGAPVVFHSDGDVRALLDDLVATGIDALHGCAAAPGMDLASLAIRVDGRLCLWGNLDLDAFADEGPALARRVDRTLEAGSCAPGYIFGTSAGVLDTSLPAKGVQAGFDRAHGRSRLGAGSRPGPAFG